MYFVYLLHCADNSLYTGITNDLDKRLKMHKSGTGGSYTRSKHAVQIVYSEQHPDRSSASKREAEIKGWTRKKKLHLIRQSGTLSVSNQQARNDGSKIIKTPP